MAVTRFVSTEIVGGRQIVAPLPLVGARYGRILNGAGAIKAAMPFEPLPPVGDATGDQVREVNRIRRDATDPARRIVYPIRDGVVMGAYVWWRRSYNPATRMAVLDGAELWSAFRRRRITWTVGYSVTDQLAIARDIINRAQAVAGGDLEVTVGAESSGRLRDRTYYDYEAKPVAEAVEQLAAVIDGFDFSIDSELSGGAFTDRLVLDYPRRGRTAAESGHVFAWGRNLVSLDYIQDGTRMADEVIALGKGADNSKARTRLTDSSAFAAGYPLLQDSLSLGDVSDLDTLDGHARAALQDRARPITLPQATVLADGDPPLGSYITGDDCHLVMPRNVDPFWPDGLNEARRIVALTVAVPDDGENETVTLTLGETVAA